MAASRSQIFNKYTYGYTEFLKISYFNYKIGLNVQDSFRSLPTFLPACLGAPSTLVVFSLIVYLYMEAMFGKTTQFEMLFIIGLNSSLILLNTSQMFFLCQITRHRAKVILNSIFDIRFQMKQESSFIYQFICFIVAYSTIIYPFCYFPAFYGVSWYLPGVLNSLIQLIHLLAEAINFFDAENATVVLLTKLIILLIISLSLAHAVINFSVIVHWLFTYHFTVTQYLTSMIR